MGEKGEPGRFEHRTRVAWLCGSSIFPAAAELQPSERIPVPFISSRFYNQCKNITRALLIIAGLLMQQWWETSRSIWSLPLLKDQQINVNTTSRNTCQGKRNINLSATYLNKDRFLGGKQELLHHSSRVFEVWI